MAATERGADNNSNSNNSPTPVDHIPIHMPEMEQILHDQPPRQKRFLDFLKARPSKEWFQKLGITRRLSPFSFIRRTPQNQTSTTSYPPTSATSTAVHNRRRRHFRVPFVRKINWPALFAYCKEWIKHPTNIALFVWLAAVAAGLLMLLLLVSGALNDLVKESSTRKRWVESNNQVLNALFTIMCLYQHPRLLHQLVQLIRWRPNDAADLRRTYSKYNAAKPRERLHLLFVLALLHITCFAQYGLCGLYWGYNRHNRPDTGETICVAVGVLAPIIAFLYTLYGPLGRKPESVANAETSSASASASASATDEETGELEMEVVGRKLVVSRPQWVGGLFDVADDPAVFSLSFLCTFCVFGWNMERLGFGNMYVHIGTFILLCLAPFLVFTVSGLKLNDDATRDVVWISGIVLSFLGLLYGGFWRMQMRRRFKLPASKACFGYAALTDFARWLFCWSCSLAQEVRTGNFYDVEDDSFYSKEESTSASRGKEEEGVNGVSSLAPLPREGPETAVAGDESSGRIGGESPMAAPVVVVVDGTSHHH